MRKLIKTDLTAALMLVLSCRPVLAASVDMAIDRLRQCRQKDYLLLVRCGLCLLTDLESVCADRRGWLSCQGPGMALYLHVDQIVAGDPCGSVTVLDYPAVIEEAAVLSNLSTAQRMQYLRQLRRRWRHWPQYCTMREFIQFLKRGDSSWM